jgi:hypothetical protein
METRGVVAGCIYTPGNPNLTRKGASLRPSQDRL